MSESLKTYLADHLAGSLHAIQLLKDIHQKHHTKVVGHFAADMLVEIRSDREMLEKIATQVGGGPSSAKEVAAWAGEKLSRIKLRLDDPDGLGMFEALEQLCLGILGKRALWTVLSSLASVEPRLRGFDFVKLIARAEDQYAEVDGRRIEMAAIALTR
jgi:hypothetical protein